MLKPYLITAPQYYPSNSFESCLEARLSTHRPYAALFRGYEADKNYFLKAQTFIRLCAAYNCLSFISADVALAIDLQFDGVHLKGHQLTELDYLVSLKNFHIHQTQKKSIHTPLIFYSAHTLNEMIRADQKGVNAMTISPIFKTPNKGQPLGVSFLESIQYSFSAEVFALGGIMSIKELNALSKIPYLNGFASIRFFV